MTKLRPIHLACLGPFVALAGCALPPPGSNPPVTMQSLGTYQDNHPPESPNGLPPGAAVLAPFPSPTGTLNSTQIGPVVPSRPVP